MLVFCLCWVCSASHTHTPKSPCIPFEKNISWRFLLPLCYFLEHRVKYDTFSQLPSSYHSICVGSLFFLPFHFQPQFWERVSRYIGVIVHFGSTPVMPSFPNHKVGKRKFSSPEWMALVTAASPHYNFFLFSTGRECTVSLVSFHHLTEHLVKEKIDTYLYLFCKHWNLLRKQCIRGGSGR